MCWILNYATNITGQAHFTDSTLLYHFLILNTQFATKLMLSLFTLCAKCYYVIKLIHHFYFRKCS